MTGQSESDPMTTPTSGLSAVAFVAGAPAAIHCAVNDALANAPETINADPYGAGWLVEISVAGDGGDPTAELMDAAAYQALVEAS